MFKNYEIVKFFMLYMFNRWSCAESKLIFGINLGSHIYDKWVWCRENNADQLQWFADLDDTCKKKLVERAMDVYTRPNP